MSNTGPGEFDFLAADAAMVGASTIPPVRRVDLGDGISALAWGDAPASVVLAHGAALNAHTWDATLLAWGGGGFLALDLPGHGDSAWRMDGDYAPDKLAPAVADALSRAVDAGALTTHFGYVGQSLGGLVGLELVRRAAPMAEKGTVPISHRVRRLVLVDILPLRPAAASMVASFLDGPTSFASRDEIVERGAGVRARRGEPRARGVPQHPYRPGRGASSGKHHLGALGPKALAHLTTEHLWDVIATSNTPIDPRRRHRFPRRRRELGEVRETASGRHRRPPPRKPQPAGGQSRPTRRNPA